MTIPTRTGYRTSNIHQVSTLISRYSYSYSSTLPDFACQPDRSDPNDGERDFAGAVLNLGGHMARAVLDLRSPLAAISASPDQRFAAVGGREVIRTISIDGDGLYEARNLRSVRGNLTFNAVDIQWHCRSESLIATAAPNASVVIWDLARGGAGKVAQSVVWKGQTAGSHMRNVNRVAWCPHDDHTLLTASTDASVKLWDMRSPSRKPPTFKSFPKPWFQLFFFILTFNQ